MTARTYINYAKALLKIYNKKDLSRQLQELARIIPSTYGKKLNYTLSANYSVFESLAEPMKNFLHLLALNKDLHLLGDISNAYIKLVEGKTKQQQCCVILPSKTTEEETKQIETKLNLNSSDIEYKIDPNIVAGFKVVFRDKILDASFAALFKKINKNISYGTE